MSERARLLTDYMIVAMLRSRVSFLFRFSLCCPLSARVSVLVCMLVVIGLLISLISSLVAMVVLQLLHVVRSLLAHSNICKHY